MSTRLAPLARPVAPFDLPAHRRVGLALRDVTGVTRRNLVRMARTPQSIVIGLVQPALLLVLFRYVLGGAITIPGVSYVDYVVPSVFLEAVLIGGMTTSISLADDVGSGLIDRLRSLPMARAAVLAGRTIADLARAIASLALMVGLGYAVGFRFDAPIPSIVAGLLLALGFGYAFSWVYASIGLATRDPATAQVAGILPFFVLMFASDAVVPVQTMPGWLQAFARNQPLSVTISSVRGLLEGGALGHALWQSLAWSGAILVVFFTVALGLYRRNLS